MKFLANKKVIIILATLGAAGAAAVVGGLWLKRRHANKPVEEVPANPEEK